MKANGLALTITRDRSEAEEVAQDAFVRAWRYAASFDARRGSVRTWLLSITRNAALDRVRARRQPVLPVDPLDALAELPAAEDGGNPLDELGAVAGALRSLPSEQRDALMAAAYYGLTAREISEAWHLPLGTVKTRLRLAVAKLQQLLVEVAT